MYVGTYMCVSAISSWLSTTTDDVSYFIHVGAASQRFEARQLRSVRESGPQSKCVNKKIPEKSNYKASAKEQ